jgi:hypothetical protein
MAKLRPDFCDLDSVTDPAEAHRFADRLFVPLVAAARRRPTVWLLRWALPHGRGGRPAGVTLLLNPDAAVPVATRVSWYGQLPACESSISHFF